jgi:hypothetical protein
MSHKRAAENQLTRDDDGEDHAEDDFVTTPQVADKEEMATRRVVKVRRPEGSEKTSSSGTTSGFFKDAATAAGNAAPAKPAFGFGFGTGSNNSSTSSGAPAKTMNGFSFGAPASSADATKPVFGFPTTTTSAPASGFNFGNTSSTALSSSPSTTFSFGTKADSTATGNSSGSTTTTFSFGAAANKPSTGFSFGLPTNTATASTADGESKPSAAAPPGDDKKALFGAGSFNFGSAVNTFVAARNKMQQEGKEAIPDDGDHDGEDDKPDPAGFGSEIVEQTERDVLATAPSKLYLFEKGEEGKAGRWAERGTGEAKLISQPKADEAKGHVYRLLVRGGYSLNATIKKNTFSLSKTETKHLILLVAAAEGPQTYLLKFTGPAAEANTTKFSDELKKVVEEVSKME